MWITILAHNSVVRLSDQTFDFQNITLTDVDLNTQAILDGTITHNFFKKWNFDLDINTLNDRFLILILNLMKMNSITGPVL